MKMIAAPGACPSINVAGTEYTACPDGAVTIERDDHIAVALANGFTEVPGDSIQPSGE